ncbi:MAG: outer membrane protein OmpA-like peptidoglycan-associated protein, partial [Limisphaerales bacterium]
AHKFSNCQSADCKSISTSQAKALQQYLISKKIKSSRVRALGFGKRRPAENGQPDNRIEVKITSL